MVDGQGTSIQIAHVGMVHVDGVCGRMDDVLIFSIALRCARSNRFFFLSAAMREKHTWHAPCCPANTEKIKSKKRNRRICELVQLKLVWFCQWPC